MKGSFNKLFRGKRKYIWIFVTLALIMLFWFLKKEPTAEVEKVSIQNIIVKKTISASGQIKSTNQVDLSFLTAGTVKNFNVKEGDLVKKDENLANIDNYSNYMSLQQYKDARDITIRDRDLFLAQYLNHQDQIGGPTEFDIQLRKQDELVSKAESAYEEVFSNINKTYISAPFEGTIIDITKKVGETTAVGEAVIKLADLDDLIFEVTVDQDDFGLVKFGQKADIELNSYGNKIFTGTVSQIPVYMGNIDANEFIVGIEFSNTSTKPILIGMAGDAVILTEETPTEVQALSFDQIFDENNKTYVWTVKNGRLYKKEIEIGLEGDFYTEIKTSLNNEELVIISENNLIKNPVKNIRDGIKIKWLKR